MAPSQRTLAWRLGPLGILLALWVSVFLTSGSVRAGPNGNGLGGDFAIFLSGSQVLRDGGNPYDPVVLFHAERRLLTRQGIAAPEAQSFIRVGNPPLLFWLIQPMTRIPFAVAALVWMGCMAILCILGMLALLRTLDWKRRVLPLAVFIAMPQTVLAVYYGNVDAVVFAGVAFALALRKRIPLAAGALVSLTLLKPQVGLPIVGLIVLFSGTRRLRLSAGFLAGVCGLACLSVLATGPHEFLLWARALIGYSQQIGVQPDIASLAGLYVYSIGSGPRAILDSATLIVASALTAWWWFRLRGRNEFSLGITGWLWILWFLATPFAHFHDEILLTAPLLALAGRDGKGLSEWRPLAMLYLLISSLLLFPTARLHTDLQSLALLPILALAFLCAWNESASRTTGAEPVLLGKV